MDSSVTAEPSIKDLVAKVPAVGFLRTSAIHRDLEKLQAHSIKRTANSTKACLDRQIALAES